MPAKATTEQFIFMAKQKHGEIFDYSIVKYINSSTYVDIICRIHGSFPQIPNSHLRGRGCPKCSGKLKNTEDFIIDATKVHGNRYDYSSTIYIHSKKNIVIRCKIHGLFKQTPNSHLKGRNCFKCGEIIFMGRTKTNNDYILDAIKVHGTKYDYSLVEYVNCKSIINVICKKHGTFRINASWHLSTRGCPTCNTSKGEIKIRELLINNHINFHEQHRFINQPTYIKQCRYDFYLIDMNMIIEYHGKQHYEFVQFFHKTHEGMMERRKRDHEKKQFCLENNILFKEISYKDNIKKEIEEILQHIQIAGTS
jgi:hypothetical protein